MAAGQLPLPALLARFAPDPEGHDDGFKYIETAFGAPMEYSPMESGAGRAYMTRPLGDGMVRAKAWLKPHDETKPIIFVSAFILTHRNPHKAVALMVEEGPDGPAHFFQAHDPRPEPRRQTLTDLLLRAAPSASCCLLTELFRERNAYVPMDAERGRERNLEETHAPQAHDSRLRMNLSGPDGSTTEVLVVAPCAHLVDFVAITHTNSAGRVEAEYFSGDPGPDAGQADL
jgi:hypothetical protein